MTDNKYIGVQGLEELISLTKNSLAKKADALQFDVMPDPVKYIGKVVQYVGISDASFTRSHFYYSDGTRWNEENISGEQTTQIKIVSALPTWINADPQVLYVLKGTTDNTMSLYVKDASVNDAWFTVESGGSFAIVDNLPQWSDASASTIYFKANGDALTCYVKNTGTVNAWYTLSGASQEVDTALSSVSTNPVQNKVVYAAIQDVLAKIVNVYHFKGSCLTAALPSEGNVVGDTWNLEDDSSYGPAGTNVAWTGTEWDALSGGINNYKTEETIIGKWVDDKPIYRKTIDLSTEAIITKEYYKNGNSDMVKWKISIDFTSLNIDSLLSYKEIKTDLYYIYEGNRHDSLRYSYFFIENNLKGPIKKIDVEETNYKAYESKYDPHATGYIILEYTKTTD